MPTLPLLVWDRHAGLGAEVGVAVSRVPGVVRTADMAGLSLCTIGLTQQSLWPMPRLLSASLLWPAVWSVWAGIWPAARLGEARQWQTEHQDSAQQGQVLFHRIYLSGFKCAACSRFLACGQGRRGAGLVNQTMAVCQVPAAWGKGWVKPAWRSGRGRTA